jgi:hypothetical protein
VSDLFSTFDFQLPMTGDTELRARPEATGNWPRTLRDGAGQGLVAFAKLMVIIAPVYTGMAILKYTGVLQVIADSCRPAMRHFGLPGDAALALVLGNFLNLYAAMGVMASLKLATGPATVLSLMLLISHSQILESSVFFQMKTKYQYLWAIRLVTALIVGYLLHFVIASPPPAESLTAAAVTRLELIFAAREYVLGLLSLACKMCLILVVIFTALEVVKRLKLLDKSLKAVNRVTRFMGFTEPAGLPLLAGIIFGIVFGGGVIAGSVKEKALSPKQVLLVSVFLALCHGLIEDTGLMIVLGASIFWITVPRLVLAVPVTWAVSKLTLEPGPTSR